jgi:hypothetical protein
LESAPEEAGEAEMAADEPEGFGEDD